MANDRLMLEAKAYGIFAKLTEDAQATADAFEAARLPLPERLLRFLGDDEGMNAPRVVIPAPETVARRPSEVPSDAIWVPVADMLPTGLVLGVLRQMGGAHSPKAVVEELVRMGLEVNAGSIQNIGTKLDSQGKISRDNGEWTLRDAFAGPVLAHDFAWGPQSIFTNQEIAAHRRQLVLHLLRAHRSGLQQAQIVAAMSECDWVRVAVNKDLIKMDIEALAEAGRVRRVGPTNKWEATM